MPTCVCGHAAKDHDLPFGGSSSDAIDDLRTECPELFEGRGRCMVEPSCRAGCETYQPRRSASVNVEAGR